MSAQLVVVYQAEQPQATWTSLDAIREPPISTAGRTASGLIELFKDSMDMYIFMPLVITHLEGAPELVAATRAVMTIKTPDHVHDSKIRGISDYVESSQLLRSSSMDSEATLLTIAMLAFYEMKRGGDIAAFGFHVAAIAALLINDPKRWASSEVARMVLYLNQWTVFGMAMKHDIPSPFEHPTWLDLSPPAVGSADAQQLWMASHQLWLCIPRLVYHLRALRRNRNAVTERDLRVTLRVAEKILDLTHRASKDSLLARTTVRQTASSVDRVLAPESFVFDSIHDYDTIVSYSKLRLYVLICYRNIVRMHRTIDAKFQPPRLNEVLTEQVEQIKALLMCLEYCDFQNRYDYGMIFAVLSMWGYFVSNGWTFGDLPRDSLRSWMTGKCFRAYAHWPNFKGAVEMDATHQWLIGGPVYEGSVLYRSLPDLTSKM